MARRSRPAQTVIDAQIEEFEKANPKVAEAMRVFGLSMRSYVLALEAASGVRTTSSSSTVAAEDAHLDGRPSGS